MAIGFRCQALQHRNRRKPSHRRNRYSRCTPGALSIEASSSNFNIRLFACLLILETTETHSILASIESATYLLLEMELCLHKTNQASGTDNFSYYSIK